MFKDFDKIIQLLCKENDNIFNASFASKRSMQRKSLFCKDNNNFIIGANEEHSSSNSGSNSNKVFDDLPQEKADQTEVRTFTKKCSIFVKNIHNELPAELYMDNKTNMLNNEIKEELSDKEDSSSSGSSSDDSSFEEEYQTKNPFVLKYQKINYKFNTYEITINYASVSDNEGRKQILSGDQLYNLINDFEKYEIEELQT